MGAEQLSDKQVGVEHQEYQSEHGRRRSSFDQANLNMVMPDKTQLATSAGADSIEDSPVSWFVWLVAMTASVAGLLFGYDTGIISAVLVYLNNDLDGRPVSSSEKELITSLCSGGAFIGAIIAGLTADQYGRKIAIYGKTLVIMVSTATDSNSRVLFVHRRGPHTGQFLYHRPDGCWSTHRWPRCWLCRHGRAALHRRDCPYEGSWSTDWVSQKRCLCVERWVTH